MHQWAVGVDAGRQPFGRLIELRATLQGPILVAVAYFVGAEIAFLIGTLSDKIFAPFWPPNVILFCALLVVPERRWWLFIAATFPAHVAAELGVGMPAGQLLVAFATNCAVAVVNALAVRRLLGDPPWFGDLRKVALYVLITAGVSPALVAFGGAFVPILGGGASEKYGLFWTCWYVSNALSSLTLGPVFLTWLSESPKSSGLESPRRKVEGAIVGVALVVVCAVAFEASSGMVKNGFLPAILYSPLPIALWATIRFGARGACAAILITTVVLTWRTLNGPSVFIAADPETNVLALQLFLTGLSIPLLLLGAAIDELRHAEQAMRTLAGSVLTAQDEERRRISRELHDSTGQNLIAAGMLVERIRTMLPDPQAAPIRQLDDMVQQSVHELRTMSYLLHPPFLDEAGLKLALPHYLEGFRERSGLTVELDMCPKLARLPSEIELALFRVVQEALTNVMRHSGSKTASIRLAPGIASGRHSIILTIEDEGRGIAGTTGLPGLVRQQTRFSGGVGLVSMRERLHQVGGWLELDSRVGRTTVTAIVPASAGDTTGEESSPAAVS
jgi:signal transduction histidine kinase